MLPLSSSTQTFGLSRRSTFRVLIECVCAALARAHLTISPPSLVYVRLHIATTATITHNGISKRTGCHNKTARNERRRSHRACASRQCLARRVHTCAARRVHAMRSDDGSRAHKSRRQTWFTRERLPHAKKYTHTQTHNTHRRSNQRIVQSCVRCRHALAQLAQLDVRRSNRLLLMQVCECAHGGGGSGGDGVGMVIYAHACSITLRVHNRHIERTSKPSI